MIRFKYLLIPISIAAIFTVASCSANESKDSLFKDSSINDVLNLNPNFSTNKQAYENSETGWDTRYFVKSIIIDDISSPIYVNNTVNLSVTCSPSSVTSQYYKWYVNDASVASVSGTGELTALKEGDVKVFCVATDGSGVYDSKNLHISYQYTTSVSLGDDLSLKVGDSVTLNPSILPSDSSFKSLDYITSNASVAYVDKGVLKACGKGTATITGTCSNGINGTKVKDELVVNVSDNAVAVYSVSISPTSTTMCVGDEASFTAKVLPANAVQDVIFYTDNDSIASIDQSGKLVAYKAGTVVVSAKSMRDPSKTSSATVIIKEPTSTITSFNIGLSTNVLEVGSKTTVNVLTFPNGLEDYELYDKNPDKGIVSVNDNEITALTPGTTEIVVHSLDTKPGVYNSISVTVNEFVKELDVNIFGNDHLLVSASEYAYDVSVIATTSHENSYRVISSDTSIITVNEQTKKFTAVGTGKAKLFAVSNDGSMIVGASPVITVDPILISKISVSYETSLLTIGQVYDLVTEVEPSNASNKFLTYSSSDNNVVSVLGSQIVARNSGSATITISSTDGSNKALSIVFNVKVPVQEVFINRSSATLSRGDTLELASTVYPLDATNKAVTYFSTNPSVATVTSEGLVTAVNSGVASIIAVSNEDPHISAEVEITVNETLATKLDVICNKTNLVLGVDNTGVNYLVDTDCSRSPAYQVFVVYNGSGLTPAIELTQEENLITPLNVGIAKLRFLTTDGTGIYKDVDFTVSRPVATYIKIATPMKDVFEPGDQEQLEIDTKPEYASKDVSWTSSDKNIGTVDSNGLFKAVSKGTVTITATTLDGSSLQDSITIDVKQFATDISNIPSSINVNVNQTFGPLMPVVEPQYEVSIDGVNYALKRSEDKNYVQITENLDNTVTITGLQETTGLANLPTLVITSKDNRVTREIPITVSAIDVVTFNAYLSDDTLIRGETADISVSILPLDATYQDYTITLVDPNNCLTLDEEENRIQAVKTGSAKVVVTLDHDPSKSVELPVTITPIKVGSISINLDDDTIKVGGTTNANVTVTSSSSYDKPDDESYTFTVKEKVGTNVVIIDDEGQITGISVGKVEITATANDGSGKSATATLEVKPVYVEAISISGENEKVIGQTTTLSCVISPDNATYKDVIWSSSNTGVATIDQNGVVTAIEDGTTTITATSTDGSGVYATFLFTTHRIYIDNIEINEPSTREIWVNNSFKPTGSASTVQLSATISPDNPTTKEVVWASSDTSIATVSQTGLVTAVGKGTVLISCTAKSPNHVNVYDTIYIDVRKIAGPAGSASQLAGNIWRHQTTEEYSCPVSEIGLSEPYNVGCVFNRFSNERLYNENTSANFIQASDYGVSPTGSDNSQSLIALINEIMSNPEMQGDTVIKFQNATYTFSECIVLPTCSNITFLGEANTTFVFTSWGGTDSPCYISASGCNNLLFKNIKFKCKYAPAVVGYVRSSSTSTVINLDVDINQGFNMGGDDFAKYDQAVGGATPKGASLMSLSKYGGGDESSLTNSVLYPNGNVLLYNSTGDAVSQITNIKIYNRGGANQQISVSLATAASVPANGSPMSVAFTMYDHTGIIFDECYNIYMESVDVYNAPGMALRINRGGNFYLNRFNVCCENEYQAMTATADAVHTCSVEGELKITNSIFENSHDDAFNIRSVYYEIVGVNEADKTIKITTDGDGYCNFDTGDVLSIIDKRYLHVNCSYHVNSVVDGDGQTYTIKLDEDPDAESLLNGNFILCNKNKATKFTLDNCVIQNKRNRGILLQTRDSVIKNCVFSHIYHQAIIIESEYSSSWKEGQIPANDQVINCLFRDCRSTLIDIVAQGTEGAIAEQVIQNIVIRNNLFTGSGIACLNARYAQVTFENNAWNSGITGVVSGTGAVVTGENNKAAIF